MSDQVTIGAMVAFNSLVVIALDTESEKAVNENMAQLLNNRTSFVIAHRLSTIRDADLILVIEKVRSSSREPTKS
jgi:ABC-type multidrug transport system fused ATPase/permease subunit